MGNDNGGTASPAQIQEPSPEFPGIALRDYFAAAVLPEVVRSQGLHGNLEGIAQTAYGLAQVMVDYRKNHLK